MITGEVRRTRHLQSAGGGPVTLQVLLPQRIPANIKVLADTAYRWDQQAREIQREGHSAAAFHAFFASDVAFLAGRALTRAEAHDHVLVGVDAGTGDVLGITVYRMDKDGVWHLDLQTSSPQNQPGYPSANQIRGIGTEMMGEALADMNQQACGRVELECLDEHACAFWRARGFHNTTEPLHMTCTETQALAARLANTEVDRPDQGDDAEFGDRRLLKGVRSASIYS